MVSLKRALLGGLVAAGLIAPLAVPAPAQAWWARPGWGWHGGWGWHAGFGWRGGVYVGGPVVVGAPFAVAPPAIYAPDAYRFIPGRFVPYRGWVPPHWGYS